MGVVLLTARPRLGLISNNTQCITPYPTNYLSFTLMTLQVEFLNEDDVLTRCNGNAIKAQARISKAKSLGQGIGKGFFFDSNVDEWARFPELPPHRLFEHRHAYRYSMIDVDINVR